MRRGQSSDYAQPREPGRLEIDLLGGRHALVCMHRAKTEQGARCRTTRAVAPQDFFSNARMHVPQEIAREATVQAAP